MRYVRLVVDVAYPERAFERGRSYRGWFWLAMLEGLRNHAIGSRFRLTAAVELEPSDFGRSGYGPLFGTAPNPGHEFDHMGDLDELLEASD